MEMLLEVGRSGRLASESYEMHRTVLIFVVLKASRKEVIGYMIRRSAWDCNHFHGFGSGGRGEGQAGTSAAGAIIKEFVRSKRHRNSNFTQTSFCFKLDAMSVWRPSFESY